MTSTRVPTQAACSYSAAPQPSTSITLLLLLLFVFLHHFLLSLSLKPCGMMMTPAVIGGCSASDMTHNRENPSELIQVSLLRSGTARPLTSGRASHRRIERVGEVGPWLTALLRKQNQLLFLSDLCSAVVHICFADLLFLPPNWMLLYLFPGRFGIGWVGERPGFGAVVEINKMYSVLLYFTLWYFTLVILLHLSKTFRNKPFTGVY